MQIYLVGGWVRDYKLGLEPKDADFVVVGSSPDEMLDLGYKEVGKDFAVFLHPVTGDEYALARKERKVGVGYNGFECDWKGVTLEEDLLRRDLTINAMALPVEVDDQGNFEIVGDLIDPYNGEFDLLNKRLSATSEAFKEDPLRVLRLGRFLARYQDFYVDEDTLYMCKNISNRGALKELTKERVWKEMEKVLGEKSPERFFEFMIKWDNPSTTFLKAMKHTGEHNVYHQESDVFTHSMMVLKEANFNRDSLINFGALLHDFAKPYCYLTYGKGHGHDVMGVDMIEDWCREWKVPNNYREFAKMVSKQHQKIHTVMGRNKDGWANPKSIMKIFEETAAEKQTERFLKLLDVCKADAKGRIGLSAHEPYQQKDYLKECLYAVKYVDTKVISSKMLSEGKTGEVIGLEIRAAKIVAIREVQKLWKEELNA